MNNEKKSTRIIKNIFIFLAGFIIAIVFGAIIDISSEQPSFNNLRKGLTIFQEQGSPINETQFRIFQVLEPNLALASARSESGLTFTGITVLIMGSEGKFFYNDEIIEFSSRPNQVGVFQYETTERGSRTVPVIRIE